MKDNKQQIINSKIEEYKKSKLCERITSSEMFAINHGFPEWTEQNLEHFFAQSLNEVWEEARVEFCADYEDGYKKALEEYKQFILNVLDGVDTADELMGNKGGGTKAIRHAIESRII
jgi:hypothetical protein